MTQEEKQLLLKDICSRYPYKVLITNGDTTRALDYLDIAEVVVDKGYRPYLRSMSSMTDEEVKEFLNILDDIDKSGLMHQKFITKEVDWLDRKMFDHRRLIPKGLALEAPENMYKDE